jgi:hypothetical protein
MAELHVGRSEPRQRGGSLTEAPRGSALEQPREPQAEPRRRGQRRRIDQAEHALAREHEARARQAKQMAKRSDHKRHRNAAPRCRRSSRDD